LRRCGLSRAKTNTSEKRSGAALRAFLIATLCCAALAADADAGIPGGAPLSERVTASPLVLVDWQEPAALPSRFRNHCTAERWFGRPYCADHCGREYQFYYCSPGSYGCCKVGYGYCDFQSHLRCHP
jgi:hypothetical protein